MKAAQLEEGVRQVHGQCKNDPCPGKGFIKGDDRGSPGGAVVENLPANAGNTGSSRGLGRSHMPRSN